MSINNLLFNVQNMSPAMLGVGVGKTQNYNNLTELSSLWSNNGSSSSSTLGSYGSDSVSLTYKSIGDKMVNDMAAVTASVINQYPELDGDYVIAIIDNGSSREARVYSRSEILDNFEGTDEEKKQLKAQLDANPLMVFNSATGLPDTAEEAGSQQLAKKINEFLSTNAKSLDVLDKAGYDPLANMLGSNNMKKILAYYAQTAKQETWSNVNQQSEDIKNSEDSKEDEETIS